MFKGECPSNVCLMFALMSQQRKMWHGLRCLQVHLNSKFKDQLSISHLVSMENEPAPVVDSCENKGMEEKEKVESEEVVEIELDDEVTVPDYGELDPSLDSEKCEVAEGGNNTTEIGDLIDKIMEERAEEIAKESPIPTPSEVAAVLAQPDNSDGATKARRERLSQDLFRVQGEGGRIMEWQELCEAMTAYLVAHKRAKVYPPNFTRRDKDNFRSRSSVFCMRDGVLHRIVNGESFCLYFCSDTCPSNIAFAHIRSNAPQTHVPASLLLLRHLEMLLRHMSQHRCCCSDILKCSFLRHMSQHRCCFDCVDLWLDNYTRELE